jgi:hypothetical protein
MSSPIAPPGGVMIDAATAATVERLRAAGLLQDSGVQVTPPPIPQEPIKPVNPYAPTGWRKKQSLEFDLTLPSGQTVRLRRLDRADLFKLRIIDHLDTLLPMLIDMADDTSSDDIREQIKDKSGVIGDMVNAADVAILACCIRPAVTNDPKATYYGTEAEQADPNFWPIFHIDDIDLDDKLAIFTAVFKGESDALKSVSRAPVSVEPVSTNPVVSLPTEPVD